MDSETGSHFANVLVDGNGSADGFDSSADNAPV